MRILLLLLASAMMLHAQPKDVQQLAELMEGDFTSAAHSPSRRMHIARIWHNRTDGYWFYAEQTFGDAQDQPYSQQFYHLVRQKNGKIASDIYTIDEPRRFAGAWYNIWLLRDITPDSLHPRNGCAVVFARKEKTFTGAVEGKGCTEDTDGSGYFPTAMTVSPDGISYQRYRYDADNRRTPTSTPGTYHFQRIGEDDESLHIALQAGLYHYWQYQIDEALQYFEQAVTIDSASADAHAWLADACRRAGQMEQAEQHARTALDLSPCNVFAHQTLADLYNPQFGGGETFDSTTYHLDKAFACDTTDGDLMIDLWIEGMRRGNRSLERYALQTAVRTGFLTRGALGVARWTLATLPQDAILLTGGDMDTYPLLALQETTGFRSDVIVVNLPLMNLPWYARLIRDRHDIQILMDDAALDTLQPENSSEGRLFDPGQQIVARWFAVLYGTGFGQGRIARHPIAVSTTIDGMLYPLFDPLHPVYAGPWWQHDPQAGNNELDTAAMRQGLAGIIVDDFRGPFISPRDRSPLRRASSEHDYLAIVQTSLAYGNALLQAGKLQEARAIARWAQRFVETTGTNTEALPLIEQLDQLTR